MKTVWIFGDQLNRNIASLEHARPDETVVLFVRNNSYFASKRFHRQRLHLVLAGMRRFAASLSTEGFTVDERVADSYEAALEAHRKEFQPQRISAMETLSEGTVPMLERLGVEVVKTNQMLCHYEDFAQWAGDSERLLMEDFYRWQRRRLGILMDGNAPAGGKWNYDAENRLPPPKQPRAWYEPIIDEVTELDEEVVDSLPGSAFGQNPVGLWATDRKGALKRLDHFINAVLPEFGPYEDAMLEDEPRLAHSMLSHALNVGLLEPLEVVEAAEDAYRQGKAPIASVEGFVRQIIGWREFVWNVYWRWLPEYRDLNELNATERLPAVYTGGNTDMNCMGSIVHDVDERGWLHHIPRLMVLGNFSLIAGVRPQELVEWMHHSFVDGSDWVMQANVIGLSLYADGGRMATKPYASGGAYINKMSNYCKGCKYDYKKRVGDDACPFTTLYWDFIDRHKARFNDNFRMKQAVMGSERLNNMDEVRQRAQEVKKMMRAGTL